MSTSSNIAIKIVTDAIQTHLRESGYAEAAARGISNPSHQDAYTHAWTSAHLTLWFGEKNARALGDYNETRNTQPSQQGSNMDLWDNSVGREIGKSYDFKQPIGEYVKRKFDDETIIKDKDEFRAMPSNFPPELAPAHWRDILDEIIENVSTWYRNGLAPPRPRDPLAIDLDGDGIETVGVGASPILFDHNADGIRTGTGWVRADDAWLVLDCDGNGLIDTGRELFGVDTLLSGTPGLQAADPHLAKAGRVDIGGDGSSGDPARRDQRFGYVVADSGSIKPEVDYSAIRLAFTCQI